MSQRVQAVMVALFLLVVVGVVGVLLSRFDPERPAPGVSPGADLDPGADGPTGGVSLSSDGSNIVVRVTAGSCRAAGGPELELSKNQSRTFRQIRLPQVDDGSGVSASSPTVTAIAWAEAESSLKITVVAADTKCVTHEYVTDDGGSTWTQQTGDVARWFKDPDSEGVASPSGVVDAGCNGVVSVMPVSKKRAKVFCADGVMRSTNDGGETWSDVGKLAGTSVATFTSNRTGYASVAMPDCKSRIHATIDGGITWVPRGCVHEEFVLPGLSGSDERLVAGGTAGMRISKNGGATWRPPTMK